MGLLRVILALVVVAGHNQLAHIDIATGVIVAVKAFFVISGFYMALILTERYNDAGLSIFWTNRLLRLMPMYYLMLAVTFLAATRSPMSTLGVLIDLRPWKNVLSSQGWGWLKAYLVFTNLSGLGIETTVYGCLDPATMTLHPFRGGCAGDILNRFVLIPQAWSISVELVFYAFAPLIIRSSNRQLAVLLGISGLVRLAIVTTSLNVNPWNRSVAPFETIYFLLGVTSYRLYAYSRSRRIPTGLPRIATLGMWTFTAGFAWLSSAFGLSVLNESWLWWFYFASLTLALPFVFRFSKESRLDAAIGELSYPIYLSHVLVLGMFHEYGGRWLHDAVGGHLGWQLLNIGTVLLLSQALVTLVGQPVDRFRRARWAEGKTAAPRCKPGTSVIGIG